MMGRLIANGVAGVVDSLSHPSMITANSDTSGRNKEKAYTGSGRPSGRNAALVREE